MKFEKGNQLGQGRPPGSRNRTSIWRQVLGPERIEKLVKSTADLADEGNIQATRIVFDHTCPRGRSLPVEIDLPRVETAAGVVQAQAELIAAMARGEVSTADASAISVLLENQRRAIETHIHEKQLRELEQERLGESS